MSFVAAGGTTRSPTGRSETTQRAQVLLPDRLLQLELDLSQSGRFIFIKLISACSDARGRRLTVVILPSSGVVGAGRDRHGQGKAIVGVMVHHASLYQRGELLGLLLISGSHW